MRHTMKQLSALWVVSLALLFSFFTVPAQAAPAFQDGAVDFIATFTKREPDQRMRDLVEQVYVNATLRGLDPTFVLGMIAQESGFNPKARSGMGAKGYMQVIPSYHREKIRGRDIFDVDTNIDVGTSILKEYLDKTGSLRKATRMYSGGASRYYQKIVAFQNAVKIHISSYTPNDTTESLDEIQHLIKQIKHSEKFDDAIVRYVAASES